MWPVSRLRRNATTVRSARLGPVGVEEGAGAEKADHDRRGGARTRDRAARDPGCPRVRDIAAIASRMRPRMPSRASSPIIGAGSGRRSSSDVRQIEDRAQPAQPVVVEGLAGPVFESALRAGRCAGRAPVAAARGTARRAGRGSSKNRRRACRRRRSPAAIRSPDSSAGSPPGDDGSTTSYTSFFMRSARPTFMTKGACAGP